MNTFLLCNYNIDSYYFRNSNYNSDHLVSSHPPISAYIHRHPSQLPYLIRTNYPLHIYTIDISVTCYEFGLSITSNLLAEFLRCNPFIKFALHSRARFIDMLISILHNLIDGHREMQISTPLDGVRRTLDDAGASLQPSIGSECTVFDGLRDMIPSIPGH